MFFSLSRSFYGLIVAVCFRASVVKVTRSGGGGGGKRWMTHRGLVVRVTVHCIKRLMRGSHEEVPKLVGRLSLRYDCEYGHIP